MQLNTPPGLLAQQQALNGQMALDTVRYFEFFCESTDLPGISLLTRPITRYGYGASQKKPSSPIFQDIMMVFNNDSQNVNLQFFQAWFGLISQFNLSQGVNSTVTTNNISTGCWEIAYLGEYAIDPIITLYDTAGDTQYSITLRQCYPILMPHTKLSWENGQSVMKIQVMMTYFDWFLTDPNTGYSVIGPSIGPTVGQPVSNGPALIGDFPVLGPIAGA